jgi:hypothetical protein
MIKVIKVSFTPKKTAPIEPAVYFVETNNFNIAEQKALQKLHLDGLNPNRYKDVVMSEIDVI